MYDAARVVLAKGDAMTKTTKAKDGKTTHRCSTCGKRFEGTGQRGRPFKRCPKHRG